MEISLKALVLAAGKGTRLHTEGVDLPKVLRQAAGRPLLAYVLDALSFLPAQDTILVVGWRKEQVTAAFPGYPYVVQEIQKGTGHAVQCAAHLLTDPDGHVLVCYGDTPLMRAETYRSLIDLHLREGNACTLLSSHLEEGGNYGRVIRGADGSFSQVVEAKDRRPRPHPGRRGPGGRVRHLFDPGDAGGEHGGAAGGSGAGYPRQGRALTGPH